MFKFLRKAFLPKSKYISVISLNDTYKQAMLDVENALGGQHLLEVKQRYNKRLFVLDFKGDVMATEATNLAHEITAIMAASRKTDEVFIKIESPGGAVHAYGYAASQIERLVKAGIKTTVSIDKVAASGGYLMACVADKIIAAPFAIVGSIGVVAEFPNFNKVMTNLGIDYKQYTGGKFKRTVSTMAPISEEGEQKFVEDLNETFSLFKSFVKTYRPQVKLDEIATGEHWYGSQAIKLSLVDEIKTSDDYLLYKMIDTEVLKVSYMGNKTFSQRLQGAAIASIEKITLAFINLYHQLSL